MCDDLNVICGLAGPGSVAVDGGERRNTRIPTELSTTAPA